KVYKNQKWGYKPVIDAFLYIIDQLNQALSCFFNKIIAMRVCVCYNKVAKINLRGGFYEKTKSIFSFK
ncbi:MAG: hypothetical protein IJB13_06230, partial [Clostridia bacterium]|nr:hypothetical protein [Clostridia bacterium]